MEQKALIVKGDSINSYSIALLNDYLSKGWKVVNTCPMPSSSTGGSYDPQCLVIIEKQD